MTDAQVREGIARALHKVAPEIDIRQVAMEDDLRQTLDIDSFDFLNFLGGLHDAFGIDVPESDYSKVRTLRDLIGYVTDRAI